MSNIDELSKILESPLFERVKATGLMGETFTLKMRAIHDMMVPEAKRVDDGCEDYQNTFKCFARLCDKFSAELFAAGVDEEIAEKYNRIASFARKIASA